jgi:serine/threonine-protein phosphatase 5
MVLGGCEIDKGYNGPKMEIVDGQYHITLDFVRSMIQLFKDGKSLPRRYVWEIVLGAYAQFMKEESLVEITLEEGTTCDVIGDVHGAPSSPLFKTCLLRLQVSQVNFTTCCIYYL